MTVTTPGLGTLARRARPWLVLAGIAVVGAVGSLVVVGSGATSGRPLDPTDPRTAGTAALVEVLRGSGVDVQVSDSLDRTLELAAVAPRDTTIVAHDALGLLDADAWSRVGTASGTTVLLQPDDVALGALAPGVTTGPAASDGTTTPSCALPALDRVGEVTATGTAYAVDDDADGAVACLPLTDGHGLVELDDGDHVTTVLGLTDALTNGTITEHDDAAMALTLLGRTDRVVWYQPGADDLPVGGTGSLASLTPRWVTPVLVLAAVTALTAGLWRGRRLGPLVVERLPVVVAADETREGRARLYERAGARGHALDQLRLGALGRLGRALGLSSTAGVDDVVGRTAEILGADPRGVRHVLVDALPQDDAELVRLGDSLRDLEAAVAEAVRPR